MSNFTVGDDINDTRDLIDTLQELKDDFIDNYNSEIEEVEELDEVTDFKEIEEDDVHEYTSLSKDFEEIQDLQDFNDELEGYGDFSHGETLIHRDYFTEYCKDLCMDCGYITDDLPSFIEDNIDWDGVADDLEADYMSVTIGDNEYLMRA